jgi:GR25 family glycosyltransferase involved in LPS biosynthesis
MESLNNFFDNIYVLNLHHRKDRFMTISEKLSKYNIKFERFSATDGSVLNKVWRNFNNPYFTTPNYLACAISHLSIFHDAQKKGYDRILILEDDVVINKNINEMLPSLNFDFQDVLYLGWIPLSDDTNFWTYSMACQFVNQNLLVARNFWGMFAYATSKTLRQQIIDVYNESFPMELDRYFVKNLQPQAKCLAITPQLFACQDIWSDNMNQEQLNMLMRSVDTRFAKLEDYE